MTEEKKERQILTNESQMVGWTRMIKTQAKLKGFIEDDGKTKETVKFQYSL
jgi:hypothetical protein